MNPNIDGRLAERLREVALTQEDSRIIGGKLGASQMPECEIILPGAEKARIINTAADLLEEYIMAQRERTA